MESSRRDLLNDMAEHRPILKNNLLTTPVLVSHPQQIKHSTKQDFVFTVPYPKRVFGLKTVKKGTFWVRQDMARI